MRHPLSVVFALLAFSVFSPLCVAKTIYVDNLRGDDQLDGNSTIIISDVSGPVRSMRRALRLAEFGDTIEVVETGAIYYESIELNGEKHSGLDGLPFTIRSNGAVFSGAKRLEPGDWKRLGSDLYRVTPWRKGHFQLLLDTKPVKEFKIPAGSHSLPKIPEEQWAAWEGSIYYRASSERVPDMMNMAIAYRGFGLSLVDVNHVLIEGLTFQHYRVDGINAHTLAKNIVLDKIASYENGRAGVSVNKGCRVTITNSSIGDNRLWQLLITGMARVESKNNTMSAPPKIIR